MQKVKTSLAKELKVPASDKDLKIIKLIDKNRQQVRLKNDTGVSPFRLAVIYKTKMIKKSESNKLNDYFTQNFSAPCKSEGEE